MLVNFCALTFTTLKTERCRIEVDYFEIMASRILYRNLLLYEILIDVRNLFSYHIEVKMDHLTWQPNWQKYFFILYQKANILDIDHQRSKKYVV